MIWRFENPWLLLLLLFLPLLVYYYFHRSTGAVIFSSIDNITKLTAQKKKSLILPLRICTVLLLIISVARPQSGIKFTDVSTEGVDIMLAIDTSGSMQALDFEIDNNRINRLEVVKKVVADFIKARESDRIGMVVFGKEAFTQSPLTFDHGVLSNFLDNISIGMAGDSTAIGSAIGIAVKRLKDIQAKSKIIILLTDGQNNAGKISPETAAEMAKSFGIKIYTIGAGSKGKAPFLVDTPFGQRYIYQEVDIDEDALKKIANNTGGKYFRATDTTSLKEIYSQIDKLEKTEVKVRGYVEYNELFHWFLLSALSLLLLEIILANTIFRKIP